MTSSALPPAVRTRLNARITGASSPFSVLPAMMTGRFGDMRKKRRTRSRPRPGVGDDSSESNLRLPVTVMRDGSAPRSTSLRDVSSLDAEAIDIAEHARDERPDQLVARVGTVRDAAVH